VLQARLFSATEETVRCYRGNCSMLQRRQFSATEETVQCYSGDCSVLHRRQFSATVETVQCYTGDSSGLQRRLFSATEETVQCYRGDSSVLQRGFLLSDSNRSSSPYQYSSHRSATCLCQNAVGVQNPQWLLLSLLSLLRLKYGYLFLPRNCT